MIEHTFCHLPGVGETTERRMWERGLRTWEDAAQADGELGRLARLAWLASDSPRALAERDWAHFKRIVSGRHAWRWLPRLRDRVVYLDIETTGMTAERDSVTVVCCYDGHEVTTFVRDENLAELPLHLAGYDLVVTYNGACFDIPFLRASFPHLRVPPVHLDLRYPLRALGYTGGLKSIERQTRLAREGGLQDIDGWMAVVLWHQHLRGNRGALPTLVRYCAEDVVGLEPLAELAFNGHVRRMPLPVPELDPTPRRELDLPYDAELVSEMVRAAGSI